MPYIDLLTRIRDEVDEATAVKWSDALFRRRINDGMSRFIVRSTIKEMVRAGHSIYGSKATVLGLTFKEDCPDIRNSKVVDIIHELIDFGVKVHVSDPLADKSEALHEYKIELTPFEKLSTADVVIVAVAHNEYKKLSPEHLCKLMNKNPVLIDVKSIYDQSKIKAAGIRLWRL